MPLENKKNENFSEWYTEVIAKSKMADYAPIQGCIVYREWSYEIWEKIQDFFNKLIKSSGHHNVYFPMFIPKSLLTKESEHFAGFTPEVAWVTKGGASDLAEPLAIRPTSETIMYDSYAKWVRSHRDLPILLNQWCSVVRWETKATKPFLRGREFLWQEGHTVHSSQAEADEEVMKILAYYKQVCEELLCIPVFVGRKSDKEKFAGALYTTTLEAMMPDGKALQAGTSHNLGQHFAKAFGIKFLDKNEKESLAWQTSWGISTRLLGALIMVHGDDKGLVLPPAIAPIQLVIVPIPSNDSVENAQINSKANDYKRHLEAAGVSVAFDDSTDKNPGWKYAEWELKGVPLRVEIGRRDLEKNGVMLVRRDSGAKQFVAEKDVVKLAQEFLDDIQKTLLDRAKAFRDSRVSQARDFAEFKKILEENKGFVAAPWCQSGECEEKISQETTATIRFLPFEPEPLFADNCVSCGKPAKQIAYFAKSY